MGVLQGSTRNESYDSSTGYLTSSIGLLVLSAPQKSAHWINDSPKYTLKTEKFKGFSEYS